MASKRLTLMLQRVARCLVAAAVWCGCSDAFGHASPINLFVDGDNRLFALENFDPGQMVYYNVAGIPPEISTDGPGLGVSLPTNGVAAEAKFTVDVVQNLLYWDGVGLASAPVGITMYAPTFDNQGMTNVENTIESYYVDANSGKQVDMHWGNYNGAVFWESHALNFIEPLEDALPGMYGISIQVHSDLHESSAPIVVPFVYDPNDTWDADAEAGGLAHLRAAAIAYDLADLNRDGYINASDINGLVAAIVENTHPIKFDLNGDGEVNQSDLDSWRAVAGAATLPQLTDSYLPADANLDGFVDVSDLNLWNTHKFTQQADWSKGDFNADGNIDVSDLNIWNRFKFQTSDSGSASSVSAVPEPATSFLILWGLLRMAGLLRRRQ